MPSRPNILVFMTDQQQAEVVAPGHPCHTPNADRLRREGLHFEQVYCPTAHCCPSRATFFTGLYPSRHGIYNNIFNSAAQHTELNEGVATFAEGMVAAGYRLDFCGKWHVSAAERPADRGWREHHVTAVADTHHGRSIDDWRNTELDESEPRERGTVRRPGWGDFTVYRTLSDPTGSVGYSEDTDYPVVRSALDALPDLAAGDDPWMLFVGTIGPHDPFNVPQKYVDMYDPDEIELPASYADTLDDKPRIYQRMRRQFWDQLGEDEVRESIAHYWAYCTMEDEMLGDVLEALEKTGQADNTVVIFLSDHGDYVGAHGLYLKGVPAFREAYHVPCIVRWPEGLPNPGRSEDRFVSLADFAPTFLELAGVEPPEGLTGRSLLPFISGAEPEAWRDDIHTQLNGVELYYSQRSVTTREYKYVYNGFDFDELYDRVADPHEMTNLAEDPTYDEVKREMVRRMWRFAAEQNDIVFNPYGTVAFAPWGPADAL